VWRFLVARACLLVALVLVASSAMVAVTSLAPGDVTIERRLEGVGDDQVARERARLGLDRPVTARVAAWIGHAARLDFGTSFRYGQPVLPLVATRAANSVLLAGSALLLAVVIGVPLGLLSGSGRDPRLAGVVGAASLVRFSPPGRCSAARWRWSWSPRGRASGG
jgi:ABC-type dipeptide/oligopeptide/nickel transport system permease component